MCSPLLDIKIFREMETFLMFFLLSFGVFKFLMKLKKIKTLSKNTNPQKFIDKCIFFKFLNKVSEYKPKVTTVPRKESRVDLSYFGNM